MNGDSRLPQAALIVVVAGSGCVVQTDLLDWAYLPSDRRNRVGINDFRLELNLSQMFWLVAGILPSILHLREPGMGRM
jgi:hypothetical protein